jgi:hypothetical protein
MRALLAVLGLPLGLALWGVSLWSSPPYGVSLRLTPRPLVQAVAPASPWQVLQVEMRRSVPGLDGVAVGDRVQFDRYGVLAPVAGRVLCVWLPPGSGPPLLTALGGSHRVEDLVSRTESTPAACPVVSR